ncbi:hypothetical protein GOBAR_AA01138 [Gossypium barbadense]|uniref:Uncharacterized protein n=1 Tax=Gossypium barbadense TaxID=3634 RepID=A0A2P5YV36_GOSBA|nr:hypothetical protein GOBAR_AA01138 [Gossypium barbadense]
MQETVVSKGELTLRVGDDTITLQARNSGITSNIEGNSTHQSTKTDNMTLQKLSFQEVHEPCSRNDRGHIHEEQRLWIEELDEWRAHKSRTHDKPKLRQNKIDTSPNQLKVGDKVLLDAVDPHIVTTTPNEEIPLPVNTDVEIEKHGCARGKAQFYFFDMGEELFQILRVQPLTTGRCIDWATVEQVQLADAICALLPQTRGTRGNSSSRDECPRVWSRSGTLHRSVYGGGHECTTTQYPHFSLLVLEGFGTALFHLRPQCSKASALAPSLCYLHAILAHTLIGRRESIDFVNTHDAYYLWCMANAHVTDLAYFIAFAIRHQTEWHQKGVISIGPYVTRLARHFSLLNTVAQSSALTLIGQMSPQGIKTMLHMRMIEHQRGTDPPQYRLTHAIDEEDLEDLLDDVPPQHEEPSTTSPRERPVHAPQNQAPHP